MSTDAKVREIVRLLLPFAGIFAAGLGLVGWALALVVADVVRRVRGARGR